MNPSKVAAFEIAGLVLMQPVFARAETQTERCAYAGRTETLDLKQVNLSVPPKDVALPEAKQGPDRSAAVRGVVVGASVVVVAGTAFVFGAFLFNPKIFVHPQFPIAG